MKGIFMMLWLMFLTKLQLSALATLSRIYGIDLPAELEKKIPKLSDKVIQFPGGKK